ncbi:zinc ribbon domain-containing protein [bacterium]|nr:zinc ribbon domain-containing protein [Verrucomicrobiota bacterium]MDA7667469.1 zinc ribbon domain-containing protein [bacterium]
MEGYCPNCGEVLPDGSEACPGCGSCEDTGWSDRARYESIGVDYDPDDFDYKEFAEDEFGSQPTNWNGRRVILTVIAFILASLFLFSYF